MSGNVDWSLIVTASQKAQNAAEAAMSTVTLFESEFNGRLKSVEDRLTSVEDRLTTISAGQQSHTRAIMRIADVQADHTGSLTRIETRLGDIETHLASIGTTLAAISAKLP